MTLKVQVLERRGKNRVFQGEVYLCPFGVGGSVLTVVERYSRFTEVVFVVHSYF